MLCPVSVRRREWTSVLLNSASASSASGVSSARRHALYRNYLLAVLMVVLASAYLDRVALGLLLQSIKIDLSLSDTQLGLLTGIAFALFYSTMGIPIARWADRGNRVAIIATTTALWSAAVALCGLASTFPLLLLARMGAAVGEAGCLPPAHSLIADYFTRGERPKAVAIYLLGAPLASVVGYFVAGWLNEIYGWRMTFGILGLPGLALAALAWFTLKEPRRSQSPIQREGALAPSAASASAPEQPSLREVCVALWANRTFRHLLFCFAIGTLFGYGIAQWKAPFLIRSYGMQTGKLGTWLALIYGLGGLLGTYLGGELAARHALNNERLQLKTMALTYCCFSAVSVGIYLSRTPEMALALMGLNAVGMAAVGAPMFATIQTLIPSHMRAMSIALLYLVANLVGLGLGPLLAGVLSDAFRSWAGEESLRYALLALSPGYLWAAWHVWRASRTVDHDLKRALG